MKIAPILFLAVLQLHAAEQISIQVVSNLSFGSLLVTPVGGRITLTPQGSRLPVGSMMLGSSPVGSYARLHLQGPANSQFAIHFDVKNPVLKGSSGGSIQVVSLQASLPSFTGQFDNSGNAEVTVGGIIDVPAGTTDGFFSSVINVKLTLDSITSATQPLTVSCIVKTPLTLTALSPLNFASITPNGGGWFTVSPQNSYIQSNNGPRLVKGSPSPATFLLTGHANTPYSIILPEETVLIGAKGKIRVTNFTSDKSHGLLPTGGLIFHVGAGLEVPANQEPGTYRGTFRVTVAYQ